MSSTVEQPAALIPEKNKASVHRYSCAIPRTSLAGCSFGQRQNQFLFFQDHDGGIRYVNSNEEGYFNAGTKETRIIVANNAKWYTPLAATGYGVECENQSCPKCWTSPRVHLFYLNPESFIRCVTFNGHIWLADLEFNKLLIRAHPSSKLSAVKLHSRTSAIIFRLFYQCPEGKLRECIYSGASGWNREAVPLNSDLLIGSWIAATAFPAGEGNSSEMWVLYQNKNCHLRQTRKTGNNKWGEPTETTQEQTFTPHCSIAATYCPTESEKSPLIRAFVAADNLPSKKFNHYTMERNGYARRVTPAPEAITSTRIVALTYSIDGENTVRLFYQGSKNQLLYLDCKFKPGETEGKLMELRTPAGTSQELEMDEEEDE